MSVSIQGDHFSGSVFLHYVQCGQLHPGGNGSACGLVSDASHLRVVRGVVLRWLTAFSPYEQLFTMFCFTFLVFIMV